MDYRDKVFLSVAENLSFSKAADELFISQPAVTKHIKELENNYNTAFFERKGNKVYLTKAGKLLYRYLVEIKEKYNELEFELGRLNEAFIGNLRLGASSTISQYLIPSVIAAFHRKYPQIKLDMLSGNSFEMEQKLLNNEIDIALVENESSLPNVKYMNFYEDEIAAVTGADSVYAKKRSLSITDIQNIPIVLREKGSGTLEVIQKAFLKKNINPDKLNIFIHLGSTEAIKNFLNGFDGIALISERALEKELLLKSLIKIKVNDLKISRFFRIAFRHGPELEIPHLFAGFLFNYNL